MAISSPESRDFGGWAEVGERLDDQHYDAYLGERHERQHRRAFLGRYAADYEEWLKRPPDPPPPLWVRLNAAFASAARWRRYG